MDKVKIRHKVWQNPIYFLAFGFGSGLAPIAPGTLGTIAAIPVYLLIAHATWPIYLVSVIVAFALGVYLCDTVSRDLGIHDHSGIVWDEVVGYLLTMFLVPVHWVWMVTGLVLFRVFDIWKPEPIGWCDKHVKGGLGIMLDDILAAIPAAIILQLLVWGFE